MIQLLATFTIFIFSFSAGAQEDAAAAAAAPKAVSELCKEFTADQMKDPNSPCFEAIRDEQDPRQAEGNFFEPNVSLAGVADESSGGHVYAPSLDVDTNKNLYESPFLKDAVPSFGASPSESGSGGPNDGTQ